jgi:7-cyano-7-deazaguanine reductase
VKYGEKEIKNFDVDKDLEIWENRYKKNYKIKTTLPEFTCLCPRSGYPDFATIYLEYIPQDYVVELKALKLFINSFRDRYISHEESANEIFDTLYKRLKPKWMRVVMDFNPRGNVHTVIEIDSKEIEKDNG